MLRNHPSLQSHLRLRTFEVRSTSSGIHSSFSPRGIFTKSTVSSIEEERDDNAVYWKVSRNIDHTIPGPFDKRVYRAIEEIIDKLPRPVSPLVRVGSVNQLCNVMGLSRAGKDHKVAGIYKRMVKQSLKRISLTGVESENAFFDKAHRRWVPRFEGAFNLFNVFFRGQLLPDGEEADAIFLHLNPLYVASLNKFYVKPLDYEYMKSLRTPLTQRLYEVLGLRFRGLRDSRYARYDYHQLCQILPITPQRSLKDAKKVLHPHHTKLQKTGYLAKVEWQASQSKQPWEILYWPGPKAREESQRARGIRPSVISATWATALRYPTRKKPGFKISWIRFAMNSKTRAGSRAYPSIGLPFNGWGEISSMRDCQKRGGHHWSARFERTSPPISLICLLVISNGR